MLPSCCLYAPTPLMAPALGHLVRGSDSRETFASLALVLAHVLATKSSVKNADPTDWRG
jgi:hypothetical protein